MTVPDELVAQARNETGLDDFGDGAFREGLAVYCESVFSEAKLNDVGVMAVRGKIVAQPAQPPPGVDWAARHPPVAPGSIAAPLLAIRLFPGGGSVFLYPAPPRAP